MRLAPRFALALGLLVTVTSAGLGIALREEQRARETARFDAEVGSACSRVVAEVRRQSEADRKALGGACQSGELVDRTVLAMDGGELDSRRLALSGLVPEAKHALDLDELMLVTSRGDVLGADPRGLLAVGKREIDAQLVDTHFLADGKGKPVFAAKTSLVARCKKDGAAGSVGLLGARTLGPLLSRIGGTLDVGVHEGDPLPGDAALAHASCSIDDGGTKVPIVVTKDTKALVVTLEVIDQTVLASVGVSVFIALILAGLLARNLGRPISELAQEASKVATGDAKPLGARGSGEIAELARSFDRMIQDLAATRRRLAATTRVAAWREVARRVAHEIKNPLAPIRAAVETLRRLRARDDPAFDEYFDEATRTVLDEVHRISNIVSEFTRFARLPPPKPTDVDLPELIRGVIQLQQAGAGGARVKLETGGSIPHVNADRDQIIQVMTNLVQNALEAGGKEVIVRVVAEDAARVRVSIEDDGPGVSPEMVGRLFEPYATNKEHGTGLGLAIAQRIAIEHGGELSYVAGPGRGAEFRLLLPIEGPPPVSEMVPSSG
jgi:two-component system nitrogen regulation sensor histidine kinase NtrY